VGVATGPILAGVGIFGLAIGLAAQSLIKDVINGLFILFEGSLAVGDIVSIGGIGGQVEKVTLRSVRVRDLGGNVHFIPNSSIERVENMTKDFSRYLLEVGVAYREDTDEVVHIMKEVDEEMRKDPCSSGRIVPFTGAKPSKASGRFRSTLTVDSRGRTRRWNRLTPHPTKQRRRGLTRTVRRRRRRGREPRKHAARAAWHRLV